MCGRYVIVSSVEVIEKKFQVKAPELPLKMIPNYNLGPGSYGPVITSENPKELQFFQFGLTPSWAKKKMYLFNARSEGDGNKENDPNYTGGKGIISKPSFRKPIRSQRCLVIADAFIEGSTKEGLDRPYVVYLKQRRPFALAGIYDKWVDPSTGEIVNSFAIITTTPNELLQKIPHHRSPVILEERDHQRWLKAEHLNEITGMLQPYPSELMNAYPVSSRIKNPKQNDRELIEPVGQRLIPETETAIKTEIKLEGMGSNKR
ncbi:MAG TPA: SOS response-associated peptidase [Bacteroidia bacterium]|nr:SOS response-associated peptidase [Bacteroidia bacterium]HNS13297.1 SOS response-associated peptidase [Bacteroidia bacterium]